MLNNIVKYNHIKLQDRLDEYLGGMFKSLEDRERELSINNTAQFMEGFRLAVRLVRTWCDYGGE